MTDPPALTASEQRVANLLVTGASNRSIAQDLRLAEDTVKTHVRAILGKLGVDNRAAAAARLREQSDREAAVELVQVAGEHLRSSRRACVRIVATAHRHGLTVDDLVAASGFPQPFITRMLEEGDRAS